MACSLSVGEWKRLVWPSCCAAAWERCADGGLWLFRAQLRQQVRTEGAEHSGEGGDGDSEEEQGLAGFLEEGPWPGTWQTAGLMTLSSRWEQL